MAKYQKYQISNMKYEKWKCYNNCMRITIQIFQNLQLKLNLGSLRTDFVQGEIFEKYEENEIVPAYSWLYDKNTNDMIYCAKVMMKRIKIRRKNVRKWIEKGSY